MFTGETIIYIRGAGVAGVQHLIDTGQLEFGVVDTKHHGLDLHRVARLRLAADERLRDVLAYAKAMKCRPVFRHGHTIEFKPENRSFLIGIDAPTDEIVKTIAGQEFERSVIGRLAAFKIRLRALFGIQRRAA